MAFSGYSLTPSANVTIAGINVNTGCPAGNLDNAVRQLMADGKALSDTVAAIEPGLNPDGSDPLTGELTRSGKGAVLYHRSSSLTTGPVDFLIEGSSRPTPTEGAVVFYYAA